MQRRRRVQGIEKEVVERGIGGTEAEAGVEREIRGMNKGGTAGDTDPTRGLAVLDGIAGRGMTTSIGGGRDDVGIPARIEAPGGQEIGLKTKGAMAVRDAMTIRTTREIGHAITAHIG